MDTTQSDTMFASVTATLRALNEYDIKKRFREDPVLWAQERAGIYLWSKQAEIARAVAANHDVVVKASYGVGKTFLAALLTVWWLDTRLPADVLAVTTAPTNAQISASLWRNVSLINEAIRQKTPDNPVPGSDNITTLNKWRAFGRQVAEGTKPADKNAGNTFQGKHAAEGVIAIGDEAVSLPKDLIVGLQKITTSKKDRRFLICNPTDPSSYVAELFDRQELYEKNGLWKYFTISALESPNFTGEVHPGTGDLEGWSGMVDQTFVDNIVLEYGEDSPQYKVMVLGEFADLDLNTLFTQEVMGRAWDNEILVSGERPVLGVDLARFGDNKSVIYLADGGRVRFLQDWSQASGPESAERIHRAVQDTGASEVRIDGSGLGGPIVDMVVAKAEGKYLVRSMIGNAASPDRRRWHNWRAWAFDSVRSRMWHGELDTEYDDEVLRRELGRIQYFFDASGAVQIESKEDMRKRGVASPDYADAFIYAAASDEMIRASENPFNSTSYHDVDEFHTDQEVLWDSL